MVSTYRNYSTVRLSLSTDILLSVNICYCILMFSSKKLLQMSLNNQDLFKKLKYKLNNFLITSTSVVYLFIKLHVVGDDLDIVKEQRVLSDNSLNDVANTSRQNKQRHLVLVQLRKQPITAFSIHTHTSANNNQRFWNGITCQKQQ